MKATIKIMPKTGVLDPQGEAIRRALETLGFSSVKTVRVGKCLELELADGDFDTTLASLDQMCAEFLSNPVVEDYGLHLSPGSVPSPTPETKVEKVAPTKKKAPQPVTKKTVKATAPLVKSVPVKKAAPQSSPVKTAPVKKAPSVASTPTRTKGKK